MDDSTKSNVTEDGLVSSTPLLETHNAHNNNAKADESHKPRGRMHEQITYLVLGLFVLILLYSLYKQNYWLVGTICFPVIAYGIYKIFDRYL